MVYEKYASVVGVNLPDLYFDNTVQTIFLG